MGRGLRWVSGCGISDVRWTFLAESKLVCMGSLRDLILTVSMLFPGVVKILIWI